MSTNHTIRRAAIAALAAVTPAFAQVYPTSPQWVSADMQVSTGGALVDINKDGWLDFVVANGNDISQQRVVVYYNNGAGQLQTSPGWQSADIAYHGHLDVADVNGDGWPDVAVGVLVPNGGPSAKLYLNNNGTLATTPAWTAPVSAHSFGVAFGDVNGDGRPDLAVAAGDAYNAIAERNCVYLNTGTALSPTVSWETSTTRNNNTCLWLDADKDGRLDLALTGSGIPSGIYRNLGASLQTTPSWQFGTAPFALMATEGDINNDGIRDLLIADNNQIFSGTGRFFMYPGSAAAISSTSAWSYLEGYAAAVAIADIDNDGRRDLMTGEWFGRARYFLNTGAGAGLPAASNWTSAGTSTVEKIVLGDIDRRALTSRVETFPFSGGAPRKLVYLAVQPVDRIINVIVDGSYLAENQYTYNRESGWVAVGVTPVSSITVQYAASRSLDMAVTNWDDNRPNQVYFHLAPPPCPADFNNDGFGDAIDYDQFINAFLSQNLVADINLDGFVDAIDYDLFIAAFLASC